MVSLKWDVLRRLSEAMRESMPASVPVWVAVDDTTSVPGKPNVRHVRAGSVRAGCA